VHPWKKAAYVAVFFLAAYTGHMKLAGCVLRNEKGEILLLHRNKKGRVQWELPGGKLEENEEEKAAALREIKEELGVDVRIVSYLGCASFTEDGTECVYSWHEAEAARKGAAPAICEPQTFDDLRYWNLVDLKTRDDLSANLRNLLASGILE